MADDPLGRPWTSSAGDDQEDLRAVREDRRKLAEIRNTSAEPLPETYDRGKFSSRMTEIFISYQQDASAHFTEGRTRGSGESDLEPLPFLDLARPEEINRFVKSNLREIMGRQDAHALFSSMLFEGLSKSIVFVSFSTELIVSWVEARHYKTLVLAWAAAIPGVDALNFSSREIRFSALGADGVVTLHDKYRLDDLYYPLYPMIARVKWFDAVLGYGFVMPADTGPDIMLHEAALKTCGFAEVAEGDLISCQVAVFPTGHVVVRVLGRDASTSCPGWSSPASDRGLTTVLGMWETAVVKWYNPTSGLGFLTRADGQDVFLENERLICADPSGLKTGRTVSFRSGYTSDGNPVVELRTV